jgi:enterochelin esterase-like enzyme
MSTRPSSSRIAVFLCISLMSWTACNRREGAASADHPRLTPNVVMRDVIFHSAALNRDMQYRVVVPASVSAGTKLPVVYLLHGGGGNFRDWSNDSALPVLPSVV